MDRGLDPAYSPCSGDGHNRRLQRNRGPTVYRDNTLIPSEAVRLLALGMLAGRPMPYPELSREVRHFTGRVMGPSLDLVGAPLEVLQVEGLVENLGGSPDNRTSVVRGKRVEESGE